ncbi:2,5-diamino-6-(ribosylamino)-4(3H)-pyrimidinone 5'-phosphate reductase [Blyttiomyces sp. JEL0837]|nr:2,5-diamino-6-(ribosylamino)-4(3H)-pyrimidinone 5'-phosphate reductase [Blyttiomyces sp. JEL0837]
MDLPRPVILDTYLRTPTTCKAVSRKAIIYSSQPEPHQQTFKEWTTRKEALETAGATIVTIPSSTTTSTTTSTHLNLTAILHDLKTTFKINTLMVEGGASIIKSFLTHPDHLVDTLIVTIAPVVVGDGVRPFATESTDGDASGLSSPLRFKNTVYEKFGDDIVMAGTPM